MKKTIIVENYLEQKYLKRSIDVIQEGIISDTINKITPNKVKDIVSKLKMSNTISSLKDTINSIPLPSIPSFKLEKIWDKTSPDFSKCYKIAENEIDKKFPSIPNKVKEVGSMLLAGISSYKSKDPEGDTINNINKIVNKTQLKTEEIIQESDVVALFMIGVVSVTLATLAAPGLMSYLGSTGIITITIIILITIKLFFS